jgi:hypothetical protein
MIERDILFDFFTDLLALILLFQVIGPLLMNKTHQFACNFIVILKANLPKTCIIDSIPIKLKHYLIVND